MALITKPMRGRHVCDSPSNSSLAGSSASAV